MVLVPVGCTCTYVIWSNVIELLVVQQKVMVTRTFRKSVEEGPHDRNAMVIITFAVLREVQ